MMKLILPKKVGEHEAAIEYFMKVKDLQQKEFDLINERLNVQHDMIMKQGEVILKLLSLIKPD